MSFILTTLYFILICTTAAANFKVILDPGHGGSDGGAHRDSFIESKIVLQIAEKMKTELEARNIEVTLTRQTDTNLSLSQRVQVANDLQADLFVSLHANWSRSSTVNGFEFYFSSQNSSPATNQSEGHLTERGAIVEKIKKDLTLLARQKLSLEFSQQTQNQIPDKKSVIRRAPFYVIENTAMPAVLIEVGFISNRREAKQLASPEYQTEIAGLLTKSILSYKEKSDKKVSLNER